MMFLSQKSYRFIGDIVSICLLDFNKIKDFAVGFEEEMLGSSDDLFFLEGEEVIFGYFRGDEFESLLSSFKLEIYEGEFEELN